MNSYKPAVLKEEEDNQTDTVLWYISDVPNPVIVIDSGHGRDYNHKSATHNGVYYEEKNVVLDVALKLRSRLERLGVDIKYENL